MLGWASQLRSLRLTGVQLHGQLQAATALQQLQRLSVRMPVDTGASDAVLRLAAQLSTLQHVVLAYEFAWDAAAAAPGWQQLPQLQELSIVHDAMIASRANTSQMRAILAGIAAATSLTKLEFEAVADDEEQQKWVAVAACSCVARLTGLRDLCIPQCSTLPAGNAAAVTALTNLSRLVLGNMGAGVGDAAAAAIAQNLTQLRHLDLRCCDLGSLGALDCTHLAEQLEQLVCLTELRLEGNEQLSSEALRGVMALAGTASGRVHVTLDDEQRALIAGS